MKYLMPFCTRRNLAFVQYCFALFCCLWLQQVVFAQTPTDSAPCDTVRRVIVRDSTNPSLTRFGVVAEYAIPIVSAQFTRLSNVPSCCPGYSFSSGIALSGGILGELQVLPNIAVGAQIRLGLSELNFAHRAYVPVANIPGLPILYSLKTNLLSLGIDPYVVFRPTEGLSLQVGMGITSFLFSTFTSFEKIDSVGFTFVNNNSFNQTRNQASGSVSELNAALPTVRVGVNYEVPLLANKTLFIAPELSFSLGLGDVVRQLEGVNPRFALSTLRFGASVRYSPEPRLTTEQIFLLQERYDEEYRKRLEECKSVIQKPVKRQNVLAAQLTSVQGINADGSSTENPTIHVEEFLASRSRYVLNTVFFSVGSSAIASKYRLIRKEEVKEFRVENFANADVLQIYYQVLNIIGKRMIANPKAEITLVGFSDGLVEKNDKKLALERAETLKEYLIRAWGVEEKRIKTQTGTSRIPTISDGDEKLEAEEQRKVEIQSGTKAILEELRFDYFQRVITPAKIRLGFDIQSEGELKTWFISCSQSAQSDSGSPETKAATANTLFSANGGIFPKERYVEWDLTNTKAQPQSKEAILVKCSVADKEDFTAESTKKEIAVQFVRVVDKEQQGLPDKRIDSYTLFSFAYGTNAPLSGNADVQRVVSAIKQTLKPGAKVIVTGYTDTRGNEITNGILALQRANAVAGLIGFPNTQVNSEGGTKINDNSLPEGRFYNRFVQVDIQTPLR